MSSFRRGVNWKTIALSLALFVALYVLAAEDHAWLADAAGSKPALGPTITSLSPNTTLAAGSAFSLTINGSGFVSNSVASFNGANRATTFGSSTQISATILAGDIITDGVVYVTVSNPPGTGTPPGVGSSNPLPFFTTLNPVTITGQDTFFGNNPSVSTGGLTGVRASAIGNGIITVAKYSANPTAAPTFNSADAYSDVHISSDSTFSSVTVTNCNLNGGKLLFWWNHTAWQMVGGQAYDTVTGCVSFTATSATNLKLSDLYWTVFGSSAGDLRYLPLILR